MTDEDKIRWLRENPYDAFNDVTARRYVESRGVCTYCCEDVFASLLGFYSAHIDHLLPRGYEAVKDLVEVPDNAVFCCCRCNQKKGNFDVLDYWRQNGENIEIHDSDGKIDGAKLKNFLKEKREEMIGTVKWWLKEKRKLDAEYYAKAVAIIRDYQRIS